MRLRRQHKSDEQLRRELQQHVETIRRAAGAAPAEHAAALREAEASAERAQALRQELADRERFRARQGAVERERYVAEHPERMTEREKHRQEVDLPRYREFKAEVEEARRAEAARELEELRAAGRVVQPVLWEGVNPQPLAVLCSAMVWRWVRGLFDSSTVYVDEHGNEISGPLRGGRAPQMLDGDGVLALWFALMICAERGAPLPRVVQPA